MAGGQKLSAEAKALFHRGLVGVKNELAAIAAEASSGMTLDREECSALTIRKQVAMAAVDILKEENNQAQHKELTAQLKATQAALSAMSGNGATGFSKEQIQLPSRTGTGTPTH